MAADPRRTRNATPLEQEDERTTVPERSMAVIPLRPADLSSTSTVGGRSILSETLWALRRIPDIDLLALALEEVDARDCLAQIQRPSQLRLEVTSTYPSRWQAILAAVRLHPGIDLVLLHEPNRPLVSAARIRDLLLCAATHGAAVAGIPVRSSVKRIADGRVTETVPREPLHIAQGPWAFRAERLLEALQRVDRSTEPPKHELDLVMRGGIKVHLVEGHRFDVRIASRADARFLQLARQRQGSIQGGALPRVV